MPGRRHRLAIAALVLAGAGAAGSWWLSTGPSPHDAPAASPAASPATAAEGGRPAATVLHVTSRATGLELQGVELQALPLEPGLPARPPAEPAPYLVVRGDSPLTLPHTPERFLACWIRAPGHAYGRVDLDTAEATTPWVALAPGGSLAVFVQAEEDRDSLELVLRPLSVAAGGAGPEPAPRPAAPYTELEALAAGSYELCLRRAGSGRCLDSASIRVDAGERAVVTLTGD